MQPRASILRRVACLAAVCALTAVGADAASAATKKPVKKPAPPVCNLVKKAPSGLSDQSMDITSADVATNATTLTTVIRVVKLTTTDTSSPEGRQWEFDFKVDGSSLDVLAVTNGPFGTTTTYNYGTATLDPTKNEIRYSISLADFAKATGTSLIKNGKSVFTSFAASSSTVMQSPSTALGHTLATLGQGDTAQSAPTAKYTAGQPSCVKVGS